MPRTLLIGEAGRTVLEEPFSGTTGRNIEKLIGLPMLFLPKFFDTINCIDYWPDHTGLHGDGYPVERAGRFMKKLIDNLPPASNTVLCSIRIAKHLGFDGEPCTWMVVDKKFVGILPYPSKQNPWWAYSDNWDAAKTFMQSAAAESYIDWAHDNDHAAHSSVINATRFRCPAFNNTPGIGYAKAVAAIEQAIKLEMGRM